jgi:dipeptidyl aminopeptidase/acylaminoacyl peptidase
MGRFVQSLGLRGVVAGLLTACLLAAPASAAPEGGYQMPPAPIPAIIDAPPTPAVVISRDRKVLAVLSRESLPSIAAVSEPILRLAGFRINPRTNGPTEARTQWLTGVSFQDVATGRVRPVALPAGSRFTQGSWSPDGRSYAFMMQTATGLELWVADVASAKARRLTGGLNAAFGQGYAWLPDSSGFVVRLIPAGRGPAPAAPTTPQGPIIQENLGKSAPVRTSQDLLQNAYDEALFEHYFTLQLARLPLSGGPAQPIGKPGLYAGAAPSPDGRWLLTTRYKKPYSYLVPAGRFPTEVAVLDWSGRLVKTVVDRPLAENVPPPFDAVVTGPRSIAWRDDADATLVWAEALDGGDPRNKVPFHDRVFMQAAPFTGAPVALIDLKERYSGADFGRPDFAVVYQRWFDTRHESWIAVDPSRPGQGRELVSRNYQDQFADPGSIVTRPDARGRPVIHFTPDGRGVFLTGQGAERAGDRPFLGRMEIADGRMSRIWQAEGGKTYEPVVALADDAGTSLITSRQSVLDPPNYFLRPVAGGEPRRLTDFKDPAPQFAGVTKQLVEYKRPDGVALSGTLYLPAGYDPKRDGPLPMLMWAYPDEFTDARVAGQVVDRTNRFTRPGGISHLLLLTQGYAIFDNPSMPIVGQNGAEPNDTYIEQLTADAQAAVDAVVALGVADRDRIAVGGHSYGAFMTANLLAHTDLFRAGIARSGAYNRTLTPFGFQSEQRTYWQATDTYTRMSPFTYADKVNEPILLIHGQADDNSGTFPIQTERFYAALKGAGANARYVVLPNEAHGYRARESSMHTLWEMAAWLDRWVKNAPPRKR